MMNRLIIYLIRKKLGLKKYDHFHFTNQKSKDIYWFNDNGLMKHTGEQVEKSTVSLNWLLDKQCKVRVISPKVVAKFVCRENVKRRG